MLPGFTERQGQEQKAFIEAFKHASPDFQDKYGYAASKYREDALKLASKYIGNKFGCLSLTLEMPFKDNANLPDERVGWNGERSASLGAAMLQAIGRCVAACEPALVFIASKKRGMRVERVPRFVLYGR
jgi:murein tripeptide amidase MpaA